jgi:mRNA interferase RelE/StbE
MDFIVENSLTIGATVYILGVLGLLWFFASNPDLLEDPPPPPGMFNPDPTTRSMKIFVGIIAGLAWPILITFLFLVVVFDLLTALVVGVRERSISEGIWAYKNGIFNGKGSAVLFSVKKMDVLLVDYEALLSDLEKKKKKLNASLESLEEVPWRNFIRNYNDELNTDFEEIGLLQTKLNDLYDEIIIQLGDSRGVLDIDKHPDLASYNDRFHEIYNKYDHINFLTPDEYDLELLPGGRIYIKPFKLRTLFFGRPESESKYGEFDTPTVVRNTPVGERPKTSKSDWRAVFTKNFHKGANKINTGLQDRYLSALETILIDPTTAVGSSKKPLTKNKSGLWRYRLGDVRIVYQPNRKTMEIVFLDIAHRSKVYAN